MPLRKPGDEPANDGHHDISEQASADSAPADVRRRSLVGRLWRGEVPLAQAYWIYGVLLSLLVAIVVIVLAGAIPELGLLLVPFYLAYFVLIVVAIWRSAGHYTGPQIWAILARLAVVLAIIRLVAGFLETA